MCIDDGRVVSNFVAQVKFLEVLQWAVDVCICMIIKWGDDNYNAGIEEGATDSLW